MIIFIGLSNELCKWDIEMSQNYKEIRLVFDRYRLVEKLS